MRLIVVAIASVTINMILSTAMEAAPSPAMLVQTTDISDIAISPDGNKVVFRQERASIEGNSYDSIWYELGLDGISTAKRLADGGAPLRDSAGTSLIEPPEWSPDSRWVYYRALRAGQVQVWRASADGSQVEQVTHDEANVESFVLSGNGRQLRYVVGPSRAQIAQAEDHEYDTGIRIDRTTTFGQELYRSGYIDGRLSSQRFNGALNIRQGLLADRPRHKKVVETVTLEARDATQGDLSNYSDKLPIMQRVPAGAIDVVVSKQGGVAFLVANGSFTQLHYIPSNATKGEEPCDDPLCQRRDISSIAWRPGRNEVVFTTTDYDRGRAQSLYIWDPSKKSVRLIVQGKGLLAGGRADAYNVPCAVGAMVAICVSADANNPPRLEQVELASGALRVLYDPNQELRDAAGPQVQFLHWKDEQGRDFTGQFFPPSSDGTGKRSPLFITYYICPGFLRGGYGNEWPLAAFAGAGIAALCVNHSSRNELAPDDYRAALSGIRSVIGVLDKAGLIDPKRVGMGGLSFGSEVTMWVEMYSNLLVAASTTSPSATPTWYETQGFEPGYPDAIRKRWGLGTLEQTPDQWKLLSPMFNVEKIHAPLLMQMPEQEYTDALDYFFPLVRSNTPADMYVFPNETHQLFLPRHILASQERNLDWFRFWLQGYEDPASEKRSQYTLWERMRQKRDAALAEHKPAE